MHWHCILFGEFEFCFHQSFSRYLISSGNESKAMQCNCIWPHLGVCNLTHISIVNWLTFNLIPNFKCSFVANANRFLLIRAELTEIWLIELDPLAPDLWANPTKICASRTRGVKRYHLSKTEGNRCCFRYSLVYPFILSTFFIDVKKLSSISSHPSRGVGGPRPPPPKNVGLFPVFFSFTEYKILA